MNMKTKQEIIKQYKREYYKTKATKGLKHVRTCIINTVQEVTGMKRKSVIRALNREQVKDPRTLETRGRKTIYTADTTAILKELWEIGNEACGELLHPMIAEYIEIQQREKMWEHSEDATHKVLQMSMATMKNKIANFQRVKRKGRGVSSTSPSQIKHIIPIFHGDWNTKPTGTAQIDTVVHCGHTLLGDVVFTLNHVDISTLWSTGRAQWNKGQIATQESLSYIRSLLPWTMLEVHPDTGSEFINWHMKGWCDENDIQMSRSRPYHKNDNMHVEERNGHVIRKYVGYKRLDYVETVAALNDLYIVLFPYLNHFVASRRVIEKREVNGKWKNIYEKVALTPYRRVLLKEDISSEIKQKLAEEHMLLNPAVLQKEIARLQIVLYDIQKKHGTT
jgi:hypothetical protein